MTPEEQAERQRLIEQIERKRLISKIQNKQAAPVSATPEPEPEPEIPEEDRPWYEKVRDFSEGLGVSALETYLGAKDLVTDLSDKDRSTLKAWKDAAGESGWGTGGRVVGEMAQLAVPGTAGMKLATKVPQTLKHAQGLRSAARFGSDIAGAGLHGAVALPEEGESRLGQATQSAAAGLGGQLLGKALRVGSMGIKGTPEAQRLRDMGVKLTPGRMNDVLHRVEGALNLWPVGAKAVQNARQASNTSFRQVAQKLADPKNRTFNKNPLLVKSSSREINRDIGKAFDEGYTSAWSGIKPTSSFVDDIETVALESTKNMGKRKTKNLLNLVDDLRGKNATDADSLLREAVLTGKPDKVRTYNSAIRKMRSRLRKELPTENQALLKELDKKYAKFSAIKAATTRSGAEKASGDFTMTDLLGGNAQSSYKNLRAVGEGPFTSYLDDAFKVIGDEHQPLLTSSRALIQRVPGLGTGSIGNRIAGYGIGQRATREAVEKYYPDALRKFYSGARFGAALED